MTMKKTLIASAVMASIFIAPAAFAFKEYPAGEPVTMNEMSWRPFTCNRLIWNRAAWAYRQQKPMFTLKRISTL